jgi:hypothetical protein
MLTFSTSCTIFVAREEIMAKQIPPRIYRCPECGYVTEYRWVLARHLYNVHRYYKKDAEETAFENEFIPSPLYRRKQYLLRRKEGED